MTMIYCKDYIIEKGALGGFGTKDDGIGTKSRFWRKVLITM